MGVAAGSDKLYPITEIVLLDEAAGIHHAAAEVKRLMFSSSKQDLINARATGITVDPIDIAKAPDITEGQRQQRNLLLEIALEIMLARRNILLDEFAKAWIAYRGS